MWYVQRENDYQEKVLIFFYFKFFMFKIGVDVMSGDSDVSLLIKGCLDALKKCESQLMLAGDPDIIKKTLRTRIYPRKRVEIIESESVIGMNEHPGMACRNKKTSSVMVGLKALKEKSIDAFFSPGNTGATLAGSLYTIGRMKNVKRPGIGVFLPTEKGFTLMIDAGANTDCHYKYLRQFAILGHTYIKHFLEIKNVRVGSVEYRRRISQRQRAHLKNLQKFRKNFPIILSAI